MKRQPTRKQKHFIESYISNGGNATQAALKAYNTDDYNTAKAIGCENLTKPYLSQEINRLMGDSGISVKEALRAVCDALVATTSKGEPDHGVMLRAADMALRLSNSYPRHRHESDNRHLHLHLVEALDELPIEEIDAELKRLGVPGL